MIGFIAKRLAQYFVTFLIILVLIFIIPRTLPGDPVTYILGPSLQLGAEGSEQIREQLIERFGLRKSIFEQFFLFLKNTFSGYFGVSWKHYPKEVSALILERLPWTFLIVIISRALSLVLAFFLGVVAAWKHGRKIDVLLQVMGLTSMAVPSYWVGLLLLMFFGFYMRIFPLGGSLTLGVQFDSFWELACDALHHATLPVITLTFVTFFYDALVMRNTMLEVLGEDFMITAEGKGLDDRTIMFKHAARNALLPFITGAMMSFGFMVVGTIFIEYIFSYPGIGLLLTEAVTSRDFPTAQGVLIVVTLIFIVSNFIADLLYALLDPRVKFIR